MEDQFQGARIYYCKAGVIGIQLTGKMTDPGRYFSMSPEGFPVHNTQKFKYHLSPIKSEIKSVSNQILFE